VTKDALKQTGTPPCNKKKDRKRKKPAASSSRPVVLDKLETPWRKMHHLGAPMVPKHIPSQMTSDMRNLHESVLYLEEKLLKERHPSYPVFTVKVPADLGFVTTYHGDLCFIRFEDIFRLFHMLRLDRSLVCLVSLSMAHDIIVEKTPGFAIMDPFYMSEAYIGKEQSFIATCIKNFLVANKDKDCFLMPYFPE
jgi:hypothetical protein